VQSKLMRSSATNPKIAPLFSAKCRSPLRALRGGETEASRISPAAATRGLPEYEEEDEREEQEVEVVASATLSPVALTLQTMLLMECEDLE
jgi:hypothetical protein